MATPRKATRRTAAKKSAKANTRDKSESAKESSAVKTARSKSRTKKPVVSKAATKKSPATKATTKKATAKKTPATKATTKKATAKKSPATKAAVKTARTKKTVAKTATARKATTKKAVKPKVIKSKLSKKFIDEMKDRLLEERAKYLQTAEDMRAEADSLFADREPGDVQFDEESGEGDTLAVERERGLALSSQASSAVEQIDEALRRIAAGTYGICVSSGKPIPKERLEAIPWAAMRVEYKVGGLSRR